MKNLLTFSLILIFADSAISQWLNSYTFSPAQSLQVIRFYDVNTGYTTAPLYNSSTFNIHKTTNGGQNWIDQSSGYTSMRFMSMWIVSPDTVYMGGNNGIIIKTVNGGNNWLTLPTNDTVQIWGLQFVNSNTGFAAGSYGHVIKTTNAGATWSLNTVLQNQNLLSYIYFTNQNTGYISGSVIIIKTTNAGANWTALNAAFQNYEGLNQIQFIDDLTGYGVSSQNRFFKTSNAGLNWTISNAGSNSLMGEYFVNANTGYACGWNGAILYTSDAGSSWTSQASGLTDILTSIYFTTSLTGYISTWYGHVLKTTNGGLTYINKISSEVPNHFELYQNYPNPFNPSTIIRFSIPGTISPLSERGAGGFIKLTLYDITGKQVAVLLNESMSPGTYEITYNASGLSSGVYFYTLKSGDFVETKKMILMK